MNKLPKKKILKKQKTRIPTSLKIGFREYRVKKASKEEASKANYFGVTISERNEIRLRTDVSDDELKSTLFHEYFHAALIDFGMSSILSSKQTEQWCQFFSACIMELARDPKNWKALQWAHEKGITLNLPEYEVP